MDVGLPQYLSVLILVLCHLHPLRSRAPNQVVALLDGDLTTRLSVRTRHSRSLYAYQKLNERPTKRAAAKLQQARTVAPRVASWAALVAGVARCPASRRCLKRLMIALTLMTLGEVRTRDLVKGVVFGTTRAPQV